MRRWQPDAARDKGTFPSIFGLLTFVSPFFKILDHSTDLDHLEDYIDGFYDQLCTMGRSSKAKKPCMLDSPAPSAASSSPKFQRSAEVNDALFYIDQKLSSLDPYFWWIRELLTDHNTNFHTFIYMHHSTPYTHTHLSLSVFCLLSLFLLSFCVPLLVILVFSD